MSEEYTSADSLLSDPLLAFPDFQKMESGPFDYTETPWDAWPNKHDLDSDGEIGNGAFYTLYVNDDGETYLQGGTVTGGSGTVTIDDILVIAAPIDPDPGIPEGTPGQHLYINASGTGVATDGLLIPGFNLSTATTAIADPVPGNTLPTPGSLTGSCKISLGVFTETGFLPANIGNVQISFCPGSFNVARS